MTTQKTDVSQHNVKKIKITEPHQLSGGTYTKDIEIHTEDGETLHIDVYAADGKEDLQVHVE